jgi:uncharacterized membrane protein
MIIGIVIFLIGLFLVLDYKNQLTNNLCFLKREDKALNILKERYARGEITTEEFTTIKDAIANNLPS